MTILAHRIALDPNRRQATALARAAGVARFSWNWALAEWNRQYAEHRADPEVTPRPSELALRKRLAAIKREQFPWMLDSPATASSYAIRSLGDAWGNFFAGHSQRPRFKARGKAQDAFRADNGSNGDGSLGGIRLSPDGRRIKLGKLGWHRMREPLRFVGQAIEATVSRTADRWFVSLAVRFEETFPQTAPSGSVVGVDLGISAMATLSTGEKIAGPKALAKQLARLRRLSRRLSRKAKGSRNRRKAAAKVARFHARAASVRRDALHNTTTGIARRFETVCLETLNVRGMMANGRLARAIADVGMSEFSRQLAYKVKLRGGTVVRADKWFPSSKTCSCCGAMADKMPLNVRTWTCAHCGAEHDRDINAARNLAALATRAEPARSHACGDASSLESSFSAAGCASLKQEPNIAKAA